MGLILDTDILIAGERRKEKASQILWYVRTACVDTAAEVSAVSIVELTHGIYRARTDADRQRRQAFLDNLCAEVPVHPLSMEIARLAGKIEGEQAARGIVIAFQDLVIGATALHFGYAVVTKNVRHFQLIPGLRIVTL